MINLTNVDERLINAFNKAKPIFEAKYKGVEVFISCGKRSEAEQLELFKKGRKYDNGKWIIVDRKQVVTMTLKSYHIKGKAIDVCFKTNGKIDWSLPNFKNFSIIMKSMNSTISYGGDWVSFKDFPHYQVE